MAEKPKESQAPATTANVATAAPEGAAPSAPDTSAENSKDAQIAALQAQLAAAQAMAAVGQLQASQAAPATFSAPSAPLVTKYNTQTSLPVAMPQKLWDQLVDEDKAHFTDYVTEAPAALTSK
jgi:hypothetical protein